MSPRRASARAAARIGLRGGCTLLACAVAMAATAQDASQAAPTFGPFAFQIDGLRAPVDAAVDAAGRIWVLEELAARVSLFDAQGTPVSGFGALGDGPGELRDPRGLALAPDGTIWVADTGNDRVQAFGADGRVLVTFGRRGEGPGEMRRPSGIAVDAERVVVADTGNDRVQVFTREGAWVRAFGARGHGRGELDQPVDVALAEDGAVYVADRGNHRVQRFEPDGAFARAAGDKGPNLGQFEAPSGLALRGNRLYVADRDNHRVQELDLALRARDEWGRHALAPHEGRGRFHYPDAIAIAPAGTFAVVCEAFEDRVQVYAEGERPEASIVDVRGQDPTPHYGPGVAARGDLCAIVEPARPSLLVFDLSTGPAIEVTRIAHHGRGFGQLAAPTDVAIHPREPLLYVADAGNARLSLFRLERPDGEPLRYDPLMGHFVAAVDLARLDPGRAIEPVALEFDPQGNLWVVDARDARLVVLDAELRLAGGFGRAGGAPDELRRPTDLAFDPSGETVYVVDAGDRRVKAFDRRGALRFALTGHERPHGVAVGADGRVFVSDEGAHAVCVHAADGELLARWGSRGLGRLELVKPKGLAVDGRGHLIVLDHGNHRAQVWTAAGGFVEAFGPRFFVAPTLEPR